MSTSTEFDAAAHRNDAHKIIVFLTKERHRSSFHSILYRHDAGLNSVVVANPLVHLVIKTNQLLFCQRARAGEVKAQAFWLNVAKLTQVMVPFGPAPPAAVKLALTTMAGIVKLPGRVAVSQPALSEVHEPRLMEPTNAGQLAVQAMFVPNVTVPPGIRLVVEGPA